MTGTHPRQWLDDDLDLLATVVEVIDERSRRHE